MESFEEIRTQDFYYVDKTGMIKELLEDRGKVNLFTRPRRFGKTLNLDMLRAFFEIGADPRLFEGLAIAGETQLCRQYMGRFPVISISMKDISGPDLESALAKMGSVIRREARRIQFLLDSEKLSEIDKKALAVFYEPQIDAQTQQESLFIFSEMLSKHYGRPVIILIDEYDVPLDKAYQKGYYDEMVEHIRSTFQMALKTNGFLHFAVLTGCLRISKESIFTGLNNFSVYPIESVSFGAYFGFTDEEVRRLLDACGVSGQYAQVREWYDGYRFGRNEIYCPWDVLNHVKDYLTDQSEVPQMYWLNTSENAVVRQLIERAGPDMKYEIEQLIAGGEITKEIRQELTYKDLDRGGDHLYSILFATGYLTMAGPSADKRMVRLTIPNREVRGIFVVQVREWFREKIIGNDRERLERFCAAWREGDAETIQEMFSDYLQDMISIRDTFVKKDRKEDFYHGILLGLLKGGEEWLVRSNAEAGDGYCDIIVEAGRDLGFVVEVKYAERGALDKMCEAALEQIEARGYTRGLEEEGLRKIYMYGIACYKKRCRVSCRKKK